MGETRPGTRATGWFRDGRPRSRRDRGIAAGAALLVACAGAAAQPAESEADPAAADLPAAVQEGAPLIGGDERPGVVIIGGRVVEDAAGAPPSGAAPAAEPGADADAGLAEDAPPAAEGLEDAIRPGPPRPLRPGEVHVTEVAVGYAREQIARRGLPTPDALRAVAVTVGVDGDRLVAPREGLDPVTATIGELLAIASIWDRSVLPVIETAVEARLREAGLFASVRAIPPARPPRGLFAGQPSRGGEPGRLRVEALVELGPYPVEELELAYASEHPQHPPLDGLRDVEVELGTLEDDGDLHLMAPAPRRGTTTVRIGDVGTGELTRLHGGALREIVRALRDELSDLGLIGVYVIVDPAQIRVRDLADRRPLDDASLRILIYTGIVKEIRTLGFGERLTEPDRRNHPVHRRIIERSPIQPWTQDEDERGGGAADDGDAAAPDARGPAESPVAGAEPSAAPARRPLVAAGAPTDRPPLAGAAGSPPVDADAGDDADAPDDEASPAGDAPERRDLLVRSELNAYLARLNRFPGRRVDAALSPHEDGGAVLDYLVAERRPLLLYAQTSNTGTAQTDRWRYRLGLNYAQLTDNDDILSLEYVTAGFSESHAVNAGYEAPVADLERWRWRVGASWNEFTASDVGFAGERFTGDSWTASAEISRNVLQVDDLFVDAYAGLRWQSISVQNRAVLIDGQTDLLLPAIGLRLEQRGRTRRTEGFVQLERNLAGLAGTDDDDLNRLGRLFVDDEWTALRFGLQHAFFLEPLLNRAAWEDLSTRASSTLAHEVRLSLRGQYVFGARLIPQAEEVVGGMFSVRGYPESAVAGDDVLIASVEYRLNLPRAFPFSEDVGELFGGPFRWVPQEPYGEADWSLVLKAFLDAGLAGINDPLFFEEEAELLGAGVGLELGIRTNVSLRLDWGFAIEPLERRGVESGDDRVHFSATILF